MDPAIYQQILNYKTNGSYPDGYSKTEKSNFRKKANTFDLQDGELYYLRHRGAKQQVQPKVVCGAEQANKIFQEFHASSLGAHTGQKKTRNAISIRFYWPGMSQDIDTWVAQCGPCQASRSSVKEQKECTPIVVKQPFELVGMDLIGKLALTDNGNQYICVIIDYMTKWPQAYPLKSKAAREVADCLLKFVHQFEAPKRVLTDQGKEFVNTLNTHICKVLQIKRSLCAPYHPQTNGLVERMNATIQRSLCKLVKDKPNEWDKHLDAVMFGLRTKRQMTTKYSPYFLMFGREARYPSEIPEHYRIDKSVEDTLSVEKLTESAIAISEVLTEAHANTTASQERVRRQTKQKKGLIKFKVGDRVWRQNVRNQQRKGGKLEANFLGPFTITSLEGKSADLEDERGVKFPKINVDHLRLHVEELPRIPHKLNPSTPSLSVPLVFASSSSPSSPPTAHLVSSAPLSPTSPPPVSSPTSQPPVHVVPSAPSSPASPPTVHVVSSDSSSPASPPTVHATASSGVLTSVGSSSSDIESRVKEAWEGKALYVLMAKIGPFKLFYSDIHHTAPTEDFESEVMNAYMYLLVKKYNEHSAEKVACIDSFEMSDIWKYKRAKVKMDPQKLKYIFGVINEHHHWTLTIMIPQEKRALFLDPLGETTTKMQKCQNVTRSFMMQKGYNVPGWACDTLPHSCQQDSSSCGAFVLKFAECFLNNEPLLFSTSIQSVAALRMAIAVCLLQNTADLKDLCHLCGQKNIGQKLTNWIGCDLCPRWFHCKCVQRSRKHKNYTCPVCEARM